MLNRIRMFPQNLALGMKTHNFLEKCSKAFDDTSENYWKEKYLAGHREKEDYARKVGQLAMQVDWLKKKSEETLGPGYEDRFTPKPFEE